MFSGWRRPRTRPYQESRAGVRVAGCPCESAITYVVVSQRSGALSGTVVRFSYRRYRLWTSCPYERMGIPWRAHDCAQPA